MYKSLSSLETSGSKKNHNSNNALFVGLIMYFSLYIYIKRKERFFYAKVRKKTKTKLHTHTSLLQALNDRRRRNIIMNEPSRDWLRVLPQTQKYDPQEREELPPSSLSRSLCMIRPAHQNDENPHTKTRDCDGKTTKTRRRNHKEPR